MWVSSVLLSPLALQADVCGRCSMPARGVFLVGNPEEGAMERTESGQICLDHLQSSYLRRGTRRQDIKSESSTPALQSSLIRQKKCHQVKTQAGAMAKAELSSFPHLWFTCSGPEPHGIHNNSRSTPPFIFARRSCGGSAALFFLVSDDRQLGEMGLVGSRSTS